jgi:hypothetical protein
MTMRLRKPSWLAIVLVMGLAATLSLISTAHALTVRLSDGTTTVTVADGGVGDSCAATGCVGFAGGVGSFIVNITTGISKPLLPGARLELSSVDVFSAGGGDSLTIDLTDAGFLPGTAGTLTSTLAGVLGAPAGSTVNAQQCVGVGEFDCSNVTITHAQFGPGAYSQSVSASFASAIPFSITETVVLAFTGFGSNSLSQASTAVPQPLALLLLGLGLAGLGAIPMWRASRRGGDN